MEQDHREAMRELKVGHSHQTRWAQWEEFWRMTAGQQLSHHQQHHQIRLAIEEEA